MTYIRDLEKKVDELQYVERIIKAAKENHYERI
jgi:cell division protein FtsL